MPISSSDAGACDGRDWTMMGYQTLLPAVMARAKGYIKTINAFSKYDNVLAYNVGNEVLTNGATNAAPFLKAAARDIKAYLTSISSSALVEYPDIDGISSYLSCDPTGKNDGSMIVSS
ncbi:hypothetical protein C8R44DRAFT_982145 [Mycena epipterygia]|nr:hypothetical protein C8R44DRAFT_982145 [Mycena epipterygia]